MQVTLAPWGPEDLPVLERANTPEMTVFLGGPEPRDAVVERHERFLRLGASGRARMFRIDADGEPAGAIGFWEAEYDGAPAYEAGWHVETAWQRRGVATEALRQLARIAATGGRAVLVAFPWPENTASAALCRRLGFERRGTSTGPWRGREVTYDEWVLDIAPLDLTGRTPEVEERFDGPHPSPDRWWPFYLPHWSSRHRSEARASTASSGLELRIDEDTPPWAPDLDGDLRVSHLQTGQFSGPAGSAIGQHRFREGLVVREPQPEWRLWLVQHGVVEIRMAAIRHPDVMVAFWPIGFEDRPDDSGEICIAEIFGSELDDDGGWVGIGVKAQHDPRLRTDLEKIRIDGDLTAMHDYAVEWGPERLRFFVDGRWVKTVPQSLDYPVQFMLDVYEFARADGMRDVAALPHRFHVERVRTFAPR